MIRYSRKKAVLFLLIICTLPLVLNMFNNILERRKVEGTEYRREGPPVFLVSDSKSQTFFFKEQSSLREYRNTQMKRSQFTNSRKQRHKAKKFQNDTFLSVNEARPKFISAEDVYSQKLGNTSQVLDITNLCPETPPFLAGAIASMAQEVTPQKLISLHPEIENGGRLRPRDCRPRQRMAFIIPYRNRHSHLHIMLNNLIPILKRQQADVTFIVIEQALPGTFNRGALLNIGFLEAEKMAKFDCFIFHDVDMVPLNDRNLYRCGDNPRHFAVAMNKFDYKMFYPNYFGAVVGLSREQFQTVNGCSNLYFGWGGEDDDLRSRVLSKNYTIVRYDSRTARYDMIKHKRDSGNEANVLRRALYKDAQRRQDTEGLNTIKYKVINKRIENLYTWITVSLNMTEIINTAPESSLKIIKTETKKLNQSQTQAQTKRRVSRTKVVAHEKMFKKSRTSTS